MRIKEMRLKTGLTQAKIASLLNVPIRTWQSWELGERTCPAYVVNLIEYYLVNERWLRNEKGSKQGRN